MKYTILISTLILLGGCVTFEHSITGPDGYTFTESGRAFGGGGMKQLNQGVGGTMKLYNKDGTLRAEVTLDSSQKAEDIKSDSEAILAGIRLIGSLMVP